MTNCLEIVLNRVSFSNKSSRTNCRRFLPWSTSNSTRTRCSLPRRPIAMLLRLRPLRLHLGGCSVHRARQKQLEKKKKKGNIKNN